MLKIGFQLMKLFIDFCKRKTHKYQNKKAHENEYNLFLCANTINRKHKQSQKILKFFDF